MKYTCIALADEETREIEADNPREAAEQMLLEIQDLGCDRRNSQELCEDIEVVGYGVFEVNVSVLTKVKAIPNIPEIFPVIKKALEAVPDLTLTGFLRCADYMRDLTDFPDVKLKRARKIATATDPILQRVEHGRILVCYWDVIDEADISGDEP